MTGFVPKQNVSRNKHRTLPQSVRPESRDVAAEDCKLSREARSRDSCHNYLTLLLRCSGPATCRTWIPSSLSVRVTPGSSNESINRTTPDKTLPISLSYSASLSPSSSPNSLTVKGRKTCRWQNAQGLSCERREKSSKSHYNSHKKNNAEKGCSTDIPRCNRYSYPQHFL